MYQTSKCLGTPTCSDCLTDPTCVNGVCQAGPYKSNTFGQRCQPYVCSQDCATKYPATACRAEGWCDPNTNTCVPGAPDHKACASLYLTPKCLGTPTCGDCLTEPTCVNGACQAGAYKSNTFGLGCNPYLCTPSCGAGWCNPETAHAWLGRRRGDRPSALAAAKSNPNGSPSLSTRAVTMVTLQSSQRPPAAPPSSTRGGTPLACALKPVGEAQRGASLDRHRFVADVRNRELRVRRDIGGGG